MRIDPAIQHKNIVLRGLNHPVQENLLSARNHSSISHLQNETCCGSIKKWFVNLGISISHGFQKVGQFFENVFNKLCYCCVNQDKRPPFVRILLDQALERQNETLGMLLNRRQIEAMFQYWVPRIPILDAGVVGGQPHLRFQDVHQFKAAVILMLDDQCIGCHQAQVTMDELENRFRGETAQRIEQAILQRSQNDTLRARKMTTFLVLVIDRDNGRFDGGRISNDFNANNLERGCGGAHGSGAFPEGLTSELLAQHIAGLVPGEQNTAARTQLTAFFLARENNQQQ